MSMAPDRVPAGRIKLTYENYASPAGEREAGWDPPLRAPWGRSLLDRGSRGAGRALRAREGDLPADPES
jgi:hypothetical protein